MKEKIVIIFIALIIGLLITTAVFYLYQSAKTSTSSTTSSDQPKQAIALVTTPTPTSNIPITITEPKDEELVAHRTIQVKGKTQPNNTVIVSSNETDNVGTAASDGSFSLSIDIAAGANVLKIKSISANGEETSVEQTITYSTDDF